MNTRSVRLAVLPEVVILNLWCAVMAAGSVMETAMLDRMVGQPVDISAWTYIWRSDRAIQDQPEAYFIPRRLERIDKIYRTAFYALQEKELKSIYYEQPDLLKPLPPKPKGQLQLGLLWTGGMRDYEVQLNRPGEGEFQFDMPVYWTTPAEIRSGARLPRTQFLLNLALVRLIGYIALVVVDLTPTARDVFGRKRHARGVEIYLRRVGAEWRLLEVGKKW